MKSLITLCFIASCALAQINWAPSYDSALSTAKKEHKNVMLMFSKHECPACDYMENVVFQESSIADVINKDFIPLHIDIHTDKVPSGLEYIGTPTFYFLSPTGAKLKRQDGAENVTNFMEILNSIK